MTPRSTAFSAVDTRSTPAAMAMLAPEFSNVPRHMALVISDLPNAPAAGAIDALNVLIDGCLRNRVEYLSICVDPAAHLTALSAELLAALLSSREYLRSRGVALASGAAELAHAQPAGARLQIYFAEQASGRADLLTALRAFYAEVQAGRARAADCACRLEQFLPTASLPPVDFMVRTSGQTRLSDFLLWHSNYAELYFMNVPWHQFRQHDLFAALKDYSQRRRTFGALPK